MTLDDLIRLAGLDGGTEAETAARGLLGQPTPSLGLGTDPLSGAPRDIGGSPMVPAVEPPLRLPGPGGGIDRPGDRGSLWERLGDAGGLPHIPFYGGERGSTRSHPLLALLALASGYANARSSLALKGRADRLSFASKEEQRVAQRQAERDKTFARARSLADETRKEKREVNRIRMEQMQAAIVRKEARIQALQSAALASPPGTDVSEHKRAAASEAQSLVTLRRDLAKLTGDAQLSDAGVELPPFPDTAPRVKESGGGGEGGFKTFQTPDGPKFMRESEGAAKGYVPTNIRETRVPNASEREQLAADVGLLNQVNRVRDAFKPEFVGLVAGRVGAVEQAIGTTQKGEAGFRGQVSAIRNQILKMRSGGAVTDGEAARLLEELPVVNDPPSTFRAKLDEFENTFRTLAVTRREIFTGTGVDVSKITALPSSKRARPSLDSLVRP